MESSLIDAVDKFATGCRVLAIHPGRPHQRLLDAYRSQVMHAHPPASEIPVDIAERIEDLHARLTSAPDQGDGTIAASVWAMSDDEARECTAQIWSINYALHRSE
jgi:hypothetical protein